MKTPSAFLLLFTACLVGCGQWGGLPYPTTKPVAIKDIMGTWTGEASRTMKLNGPGVHYTFQFDLRSDGTFNQTIKVSGDPNSTHHVGKWSIDGGRIDLDEAVVEDFDLSTGIGKWIPQGVKWDIIDDSEGFLIFGGLSGDPDSWRALERRR